MAIWEWCVLAVIVAETLVTLMELPILLVAHRRKAEQLAETERQIAETEPPTT